MRNYILNGSGAAGMTGDSTIGATSSTTDGGTSARVVSAEASGSLGVGTSRVGAGGITGSGE